MYVPAQFEESRTEVLHALMREHPFAMLVTVDDGPVVNHLPLYLDTSAGEVGTLRGHVARANPLWQRLDGPCVAVFQGPQAYVTPSWYPSKRQHGKAVPTWNYAVVHAHGAPRAVEERDWLLANVSELTDHQEAGQALPWKVSDAPADFTDQMLRAIVGIEISLSGLKGKWKVSQNRPRADRMGVAAGLASVAAGDAPAMAALVQGTLD